MSRDAMERAANRLHHVGMRYIGAMREIATGKPQMFIGAKEPGVHELRDLIGLMLIVRAELNAIVKLLTEEAVLRRMDLQKAFAEEYDWLAKKKAEQFGFRVTDQGIVFPGLEPPEPKYEPEFCDCDLRNRQWNSHTGKCETCGRGYKA